MSIAQMSATMQKAVIERVRKSVLASTDEGQSAFVQYLEKGKVKEGFAKGSPFDLDAIRTSTNLASQGYESIVSRGGLKGLADSFLKLSQDATLATEEVQLAQLAGNVLKSDTLYSAFKGYIERIYGIGKASGTVSATGFMYQRAKASEVKIGTNTNNSDGDFISFRNLNHGDLKIAFAKFLKEERVVEDSALLEYISKSLDAGHLTGVFNIKLRNVFNLTITQKDANNYRTISATSGTDEEINSLFTKMMLLLADADYLSSNIVRDIELFSVTSKRVYTRNNPQVSVELQLKVNNGKAGAKLSGLGSALNKLVKSADRIKSRVDAEGAKLALGSALKNFASVAEYVQQLGQSLLTEELGDKGRARVLEILKEAETAEAFFKTKGSDSIEESIEKTIVAILLGKQIPKAQTTIVKSKSKIQIPSTKKSKVVVPVRKPTKKIINTPRVKLDPNITSLATLQNLLDSSLYEKIKQNMGTGNNKRILNFRTGRLASSARIQRLTGSRETMVTAFYTYMKNPYATFSEGGKQMYPKTRDPKTLISKSIRELGATLAYTRMRAVLV